MRERVRQSLLSDSNFIQPDLTFYRETRLSPGQSDYRARCRLEWLGVVYRAVGDQNGNYSLKDVAYRSIIL